MRLDGTDNTKGLPGFHLFNPDEETIKQAEEEATKQHCEWHKRIYNIYIYKTDNGVQFGWFINYSGSIY